MRTSVAKRVVGLSLVGIALACGGIDAAGSGETETGGASSGPSGDTSTDPSAGPGSSGSATSDASGGTTSSGTSAEDDTAEASSTSGEPIGCPGTPVEPGDYAGLQLEFGGETRTYSMYVPSSYDGTSAVPLVFNFHGFSSNAAQQIFFSDLNTDAEERGMIAVYPNGVVNSWNAGACCGVAAATDIDDVGFVRALLDEVAETLCIDRDRVYATGMSNGGFFSHRLACEASDIIAAVGPVAGPLGIPEQDCQPARPVPILHFHGTADLVVPYPGNAAGFPPVEASLRGWADRNGCNPDSTVSLEMDDVSCQTWDECDDDATVTLCTVAGAGHCWPGQAFCPSGVSSMTVRANTMILDLFEQHPLP